MSIDIRDAKLPEELPQPTGITTQQLRALRNADSVCVDQTADNKAQLRAIVREEHSSTGFEQTVNIPVFAGCNLNGKVGFEHFGSAKFHRELQTFLALVRAGDEIVVTFRPDHGSTGYTKAAEGNPDLVEDGDRLILRYQGLHVDNLYFTIRRPKKNYTFLMSVSCCPDNAARMIHPPSGARWQRVDITELARIPIGEDVALRLTLITNDEEDTRMRLAGFVPSLNRDLAGTPFPIDIIPRLIEALQNAYDEYHSP